MAPVEPVEWIEVDGKTVALVVRGTYEKRGVTFFTPGTWSQQLGYMLHPGGHVIEPHVHNHHHRNVFETCEVLFIRRGRLRVDFYGEDRKYRVSRELGAGDVILLAQGGHGFEMLEEVEMIEVKQGPYAGDADKTRFPYDPKAIPGPHRGGA
jgi:mannose-6-phosphate isomerase-like protein (cupin superfamily)